MLYFYKALFCYICLNIYQHQQLHKVFFSFFNILEAISQINDPYCLCIHKYYLYIIDNSCICTHSELALFHAKKEVQTTKLLIPVPSYTNKYFLFFPSLNVLAVVIMNIFKPHYSRRRVNNFRIQIHLLSHIYLVVAPQAETLPANNEKIKQRNEGKA